MHPWSPSRRKQLVIVNSFYIFLCYIRLFRIQMSRKYLFMVTALQGAFQKTKKEKKNEKRAAPHDVCQEQQQLQLSLS